ncbi:helix-turn-helix domain-containing protein [Herbiconiux sp. CPCC 205716]|uniref:Helix-turn-helix domain-containing protein n=1 Tax=Herbiconiux gentiana TaxID=2970912 RepID=A0ABT2GL39_9MICO|nr:helix-turn-helix domain-containing protein [Herbiconiux gentiana]MCS5716010.1 helix-turn-helix domain-containing protein [Herbiconiux gentiana]
MQERIGRMSPPRTDRVEIGTAVRQNRRAALLDQHDLADLAGISVRTLRDIETGRGNPGVDALLSVLSVLGLRVEVAR